MSVVTKDVLLEKFKNKFGSDSDDGIIEILEDISDTYSDLEEKAKDNTDWKEKYEINDAEWRKKYTDRFYNKEETNNEEKENENDSEKEMKTFDDLFEVEE